MKKIIFGFALCTAIYFGIAASRVNIFTESAPATLIETGTGTTVADGTVTNSFTTVFGAAPKVVCTQTGTVITSSNCVVSITTSNFLYRAGAGSVVVNYIAVGAL
jgi:hypothetical protein